MEARALLRQLDGALVACAARTEAGQDASASDMTSLASVVEALAKQLALQSSFAIYSSISAQPQLNGPALSQTGDSPDQLAESELQGLSQQVCSEVQRLIFSDADGLPRLDLEPHIAVLLRLHLLLHPHSSSPTAPAADAASSSSPVPPRPSASAGCTAAGRPSELAMHVLAAMRQPTSLQTILGVADPCAPTEGIAQQQAVAVHAEQLDVALQLVETLLQSVLAQPQVLGIDGAAASEALDNLLVLHESLSVVHRAGRSPSAQPGRKPALSCTAALQLAAHVHASLQPPATGAVPRPRALVSYSDKGRQSTRPAPQRHQAHQPGTVANLLHMLDSCILLHGWDGGPEQPAKALQLAYQLCALGAQGPQPGYQYSKGCQPQAIDLAAAPSTPLPTIPIAAVKDAEPDSIRPSKRQKVAAASAERLAHPPELPVPSPQPSNPAGSKRRIKAEPVPLDGPEQAEDAAGAGFAPWADMESRGDDPAAEEYWEDYLRVKMEMVSTVLQEQNLDGDPEALRSPTPPSSAGSPGSAVQSPKPVTQQVEGTWTNLHVSAVQLLQSILPSWPDSNGAEEALQSLVAESLSAALAKEMSKCVNRIGASHLGTPLWILLSGKQPAYRGVILLYFAAQLLQGFRAHSPEGNQAELRIRLTMAFLPLLGSLGDCTAKDAGTLSAGDRQALFLAGELLDAMLLKRLVPLTHLPPEGVRQLLRLLLLCQPAQHVLPAATGILWAVAQGRVASLESAPPACLRVMRPHTAALWQALGDTRARGAAMTTLLAYAAQQLAGLASALPTAAAAAAQTATAAGATELAEWVQPLGDAIAATCDAILREAPGGVGSQTICTHELLGLLLPLAVQHLHLCAEGAKLLGLQLSRSSPAAFPPQAEGCPSQQQADSAPRLHQQHVLGRDSCQQQHPWCGQAQAEEPASTDSSAGAVRKLMRLQKAGHRQGHFQRASSPGEPSAPASRASSEQPVSSPATRQQESRGGVTSAATAQASADAVRAPGLATAVLEQASSRWQQGKPLGPRRDPRLKENQAHTASVADASGGADSMAENKTSMGSQGPTAAEPSTSTTGLEAGAGASETQYDQAVLSNLAILHSAGLSLGLAGQQLLHWRDSTDLREHSSLFQALQEAVQRMQTGSLLPVAVAQAMSRLLLQHVKVQATRRTALDHARDQRAHAAELQSHERQAATSSASSHSSSDSSSESDSEVNGSPEAGRRQEAHNKSTDNAGGRGRGKSTNAYVQAALAEGGSSERYEDLDDFIVCQPERDYDALFSSDFSFRMH